ncbi:Serine/Threonine-Protein Kinase D3 [Manis pentadactyla]|nr:Serine/Threonine-Protein Kinase D3 [Manis pentadactyla]
MLMDPRRARRRHPPGAHAGAAPTSPPASRPLGSRPCSCPFSALPRRAEGGCHHGRSAPGGGEQPGLGAAGPAGLKRARQRSGSRCRESVVEGPERALLRGEGDSDSSEGWKDPGVWAATLG